MREVEANFALATKERELKGADCPPSLVAFLETCQQRIAHLQAQCRTATEAFNSCVEFYGESSRSQQPHTFFSRLVDFNKKFQQAVQDNEARHAAEQRARDEQARKEKVAASRQRLSERGNREDDVISELEQRLLIANGHTPTRAKKNQKSKLDSSQINDGDFEKIMNGRSRRDCDDQVVCNEVERDDMSRYFFTVALQWYLQGFEKVLTSDHITPVDMIASGRIYFILLLFSFSLEEGANGKRYRGEMRVAFIKERKVDIG
uniref:FH2 domain-containing protein n=1 Tax=Parascaris equorum TaxID=6256 RepID=A0A914RA07_PAREQ